jgi:hypothetical protein
MRTTAPIREFVERMAARHGVVAASDYASVLADQLNRIEGIEGDETLALIATMMREGILSDEEGTRLIIKHSDEVDVRRR